MSQPYPTPDDTQRADVAGTRREVRENVVTGDLTPGYAAPNERATYIASPGPLGLSMLAFVNAIIGCYYAGFVVSWEAPGLRPALAAVTTAGGIVLILAGMWEFRKNSLGSATLFTSYGGFLAVLGLTFMPVLGILAALIGGRALQPALGLFFLCWTIFSGVLLLGMLRTNPGLLVTTGLLFLAYLFLTIGELASNNIVLTRIGGWIAIVCAVVAWLVALASFFVMTGQEKGFRLPFGNHEPIAVE